VVCVSIQDSSTGITDRNCSLHSVSHVLILPSTLALFGPRLLYTHPNKQATPAAYRLANALGHTCMPSLNNEFRSHFPRFGVLLQTMGALGGNFPPSSSRSRRNFGPSESKIAGDASRGCVTV
jgi:hypothetical protein